MIQESRSRISCREQTLDHIMIDFNFLFLLFVIFFLYIFFFWNGHTILRSCFAVRTPDNMTVDNIILSTILA